MEAKLRIYNIELLKKLKTSQLETKLEMVKMNPDLTDKEKSINIQLINDLLGNERPLRNDVLHDIQEAKPDTTDMQD